jgi:hypothetical protein
MTTLPLLMEWKPTDVTILLHIYCWISTCFGPPGPSSGEFVQLFTQPLVPDGTTNKRNHVIQHCCITYCCTNSTEDGPVGPKHVEIQQYTNKIVTSVGFHSICWKDAQYKKLKTPSPVGFHCTIVKTAARPYLTKRLVPRISTLT